MPRSVGSVGVGRHGAKVRCCHHRRVVASAVSGEDVARRRARESARVEERAKYISSKNDLDAALTLAEDRLVILEVYTDEECDLGNVSDENNPVWNNMSEAHDKIMEPCRRLSSTISRVARDADGVDFLLLDAAESAETAALATSLGARLHPTVQFWKSCKLVYQIEGATGADTAIAEGSMYLGDAMSGGEHVSDFITEIKNKADLDDLLSQCSLPGQGPRGVTISASCDQQICVLDVSLATNSPGCMHSFPAVVALAKNTRGAIRWGRLMGDMSEEAAAFMAQLGVTQAPTFLFLNSSGQEIIGRYSGSDRVQLMNSVVTALQKQGISLPEPPAAHRMSTAEAKKIAQEKRAREKAAGIRPTGW